MSTSNVVSRPVESNEAKTVEELISVLRSSGLPIISAAVIRDLRGAELSGEYDDPTADEGYTEDWLELASPTRRGGITYLLLGLGGLPSDFEPGIQILKWEGQK